MNLGNVYIVPLANSENNTLIAIFFTSLARHVPSLFQLVQLFTLFVGLAWGYTDRTTLLIANHTYSELS